MTTHTHPKPAGTPTWADLISPDPEASRAFYGAVFGWNHDIGAPEFGGYATSRVGTRAVAGIGGVPPGAPPPMSARWNLYFASDDAGADVARAAALGAQVEFPAMAIGEFGSMATLIDPTGGAFGFWQAGSHIGAEVTDEPGSVTWREMYSPDAKRSRDFYTALLNATADPMPGGMEYYVLKHGDNMLGGIMQIDPSWGGMSAQWVSYFTVANVDETVATVVEHGGRIMGNIDDSPFGRIAALADPAGALFKILQPPAG